MQLINHNIEVGSLFSSVLNSMTNDMQSTKISGDPDYDCGTMIKRHITGNVELAKLEIQYGSNAELVQMANEISNRRATELNEIDKFLQQYSPEKRSQAQRMQMQSLAMHGAYVDLDFGTLTIQHYKNAISLSRIYLLDGKDSDVIGLANNIINIYSIEIDI